MRGLRTLPALLLIATAPLLASPASGDLPRLDPLAKTATRIGPHFQVALNVVVKDFDEAELCKVYSLDDKGQLQLTMGGEPLAKISLLDATADEAVKKVTAAIRRYYKVDPQVKVGITRIPRIRVEVFGATFLSGAFLLPVGSHLSDALTERGYFPNADLSRVQVERTAKDGSRVRLLADFRKTLEEGAPDSDRTNPVLESGDTITLEVKPEIELPKTFGIIGEVKQPNFYAYKKGMTVRDALTQGLGLLESADPESVTITRSRQNQFFKVNALRAMEGIETDNLELRPDDIVVVGRKDRGLRYAVAGEVAAPNSWDFKGDVTLMQAIAAAGGFRPDADRKNVVLSRNFIHDPAHPSSIVLDVDKIAAGQMTDPKLQAGDVVHVFPKRKQQSPLLQIGMFLLRRFLPF